jgi:hypothetical protein
MSIRRLLLRLRLVTSLMFIAYALVCASFVPLGVATLRRIGPKKVSLLHENTATIAADLRAKAWVTDCNWLTFSCFCVAAVLTATWSWSIAVRAAENGMHRPRLRRAAYGWLIPFGCWVIGFQEVLRVSRARNLDFRLVRRWQVLFFAASVFGLFSRGGEDSADHTEILTVLRGQGWMRLADTVVFAVAAGFAAVAVRDINRSFLPHPKAVSGATSSAPTER